MVLSAVPVPALRMLMRAPEIIRDESGWRDSCRALQHRYTAADVQRGLQRAGGGGDMPCSAGWMKGRLGWQRRSSGPGRSVRWPGGFCETPIELRLLLSSKTASCTQCSALRRLRTLATRSSMPASASSGR